MTRRSRQQEFPFKRPHGGKRKGAGRPNFTGRRGHLRRPRIDHGEPVHVTLKLVPGLPSLRRKEVFKCLREAVKKARMSGFSVAHFAVLSNHLHFILEPKDAGLGQVLQSLCISFAKRLNHLLEGRKGAVFADRYHVHVFRTPTEVRRALEYVLTNESRHRARRLGGKRPIHHQVRIDPYSSALAFNGWTPLCGKRVKFEFSTWPEAAIEAWHDEILAPARGWLLKSGWKRAA